MDQQKQLEQELISFAERQYQQQKQFAEKLLSCLRELQPDADIIQKLAEVANSFTDQQMASIDPNYAGSHVGLSHSPGIPDEAYEKDERIFDLQLRLEINKFKILVSSLSDLSLKRSILEWGRAQALPHLKILSENKKLISELESKIHTARGSVPDSATTAEPTDTLALLESDLTTLKRTNETSNVALATIATNMRKRFEVDSKNPNDASSREIFFDSNTDDNKFRSQETHQYRIGSQPSPTPTSSRSTAPAIYEITKSRSLNSASVDSAKTLKRGTSFTRNFNDDLKNSVSSLAEAVLEVLSDGNKRNLSEIASAIWTHPESVESGEYQKIKKTLTATIAREVQRGNIFRRGRGVFSTCEMDTPQDVLGNALSQECIEIHRSKLNPNDISILREELFTRINDEKNHSTQNRTFQAAPISRDIVQLLDRVSEVDDLAIPRLGVELKIIKKKGSLFTFEDDKIGVLDQPKIEISSEGLEVDTEEAYLTILRFVSDSPIITFLEEHTTVRDEISALIRLNLVCIKPRRRPPQGMP